MIRFYKYSLLLVAYIAYSIALLKTRFIKGFEASFNYYSQKTQKNDNFQEFRYILEILNCKNDRLV